MKPPNPSFNAPKLQDPMNAMSKLQLAQYAGVSVKTLMSWCEPFKDELTAMGMKPNKKVLPPHIVKFIIAKFDIDIE